MKMNIIMTCLWWRIVDPQYLPLHLQPSVYRHVRDFHRIIAGSRRDITNQFVNNIRHILALVLSRPYSESVVLAIRGIQ